MYEPYSPLQKRTGTGISNMSQLVLLLSRPEKLTPLFPPHTLTYNAEQASPAAASPAYKSHSQPHSHSLEVYNIPQLVLALRWVHIVPLQVPRISRVRQLGLAFVVGGWWCSLLLRLVRRAYFGIYDGG
jgi:hypothetical protein